MADPNKPHSEIEVKLYVPLLEPVQTQLDVVGATLVSGRTFEHNLRYDNAEGTLASKGFVLRLRRDKRNRITYKEPLDPVAQHRGVHSRYEAEVTVDDFETTDTILQKLGFSVVMAYEKYRTTYHADGAEIVLDEMPYGHFVEIEAADEATIDRTADRLGLSMVPRLSYSYARLFEHVQANLGLTFRDLTFANFAGITVPLTAFDPPQPKGEPTDEER
jgi:adenylate cyclase, class 2